MPSGLPGLSPVSTSSGLGSLAQSARSKELRSARMIFILIGVLTLAANAVGLAMLDSQVDEAIKAELKAQNISASDVDPQEMARARESIKRIAYLILGGAMLLGVVDFVLA